MVKVLFKKFKWTYVLARTLYITTTKGLNQTQPKLTPTQNKHAHTITHIDHQTHRQNTVTHTKNMHGFGITLNTCSL